ncbi:MAG TPA: glycosyltransferase [Candidatus Paceibacterota bacterium]|nr:glycosyltransferase [Candidatus Paceibacterota bacterium]
MKLSIVIPTLQEESAIGDMLYWLRTALKMPHEVIVADGHSTDRTVEIAKRYEVRVLVAPQSEKPSPARQRNEGGRVAEGEYICFLDCSVSFPNPNAFFEHAIARFEREPDLLALTGPQRTIPALEKGFDRINWGILNLAIRIKNNWLGIGEASGKFMMVRKSAFEKVGGLRDDLITREDADFFWRLSHIGKTRFDPTLMIFHTARRAHQIGWFMLWWVWMRNTVWVALFDTAIEKEWTPVR